MLASNISDPSKSYPLSQFHHVSAFVATAANVQLHKARSESNARLQLRQADHSFGPYHALQQVVLFLVKGKSVL